MTDQQRYDLLLPFFSENKRSLFDRLAPMRTRHVTVVMENIFQSQNASAVIRTCDLVGVQSVHVIEDRNPYKLNPDVTLGSSKWVDLERYRSQTNNVKGCLDTLRAKGYRIIATSPRSEHTTPTNIDLQKPMAFCFGTELTGLSDELMEQADEHIRIPMYGFTESFNISASAAIVLYTIMERLRASKVAWQLSEQDLIALKLQWARTVVQHADQVEARLLRDAGIDPEKGA